MEIAVYVMSQDRTRQAKQGYCCHQLFHFLTDKLSMGGHGRFDSA
jgi:hypothetical protein